MPGDAGRAYGYGKLRRHHAGWEVDSIRVELELEMRGPAHVRALASHLEKKGYSLAFDFYANEEERIDEGSVSETRSV